MVKYSINAQHKSCIERIIHCKNYEKKIENIIITEEYDLEITDKDDIKSLINTYEDCYFINNTFILKRPITKSEIETKKHNNNNVIECSVKQLLKWMDNSDKSKNEILSYLDRHSIKIEGIN